MRAFLFIPLLLVLALSSLAGWRATVMVLLCTAGWGIVVLLTRFPPIRRDSHPRFNRWVAALLLAGFAWLSGAGRYPGPTVGVVGFAVFHGVILGGYGVLLFQILRRAGKEERLDEDFLRRDLWLLNLGIFCFVFICLVEILRSRFSAGLALAAFVRAVQPLSLLLLVLLALRAGKEAAGEKCVAWMTVAAAAFSLCLGGLRVAEIEYALREARGCLLEGKSEKALEALDAAKSANRFLEMTVFAERESQLRSRAYAADNRRDLALRQLASYLQGRILRRGEDAAPWKVLLGSYLETRSLDEGFFPQVNRRDGPRSLRRLHEELARYPEEEERLLALFLQNGFPDRLEERYAWSGLPAPRDADALELALERWRRGESGAEARASFLLGVFLFETESYANARRVFDAVLEKAPEHHNAITFLERLSLMEEDMRQLARLRRLPRRVLKEDMMGGRVEGSSVLYSALETNAGPYDFRFEARCAGNAPATFRVFLDDAAKPVLDETVSSPDWTEVGFEKTFEGEERHTLLIVLGGAGEESEAAGAGDAREKPAVLFRALNIRPGLE